MRDSIMAANAAPAFLVAPPENHIRQKKSTPLTEEQIQMSGVDQHPGSHIRQCDPYAP